MRCAAIVATLMIGSVPAVRAQTPSCLRLRIETGDRNPPALSTPEGTATASVSLKDGDDFRQLFIDLVIRDHASGVVHASVRDGRAPDSPVLSEFDVSVGSQTIQTSTSPSFGLSIVEIYEPTRYGIRYSCQGRPTPRSN
jgi:hypothetical protein